MRLIEDFLFLILFFMLIGVWLLVWIGLHLAGGVVHLLLLIGVIALILHLAHGRRAVQMCACYANGRTGLLPSQPSAAR